MPYEPAINTTQSTEKLKYWLDKAVEAAHREGLGIIGFIVAKDGDKTLFEPFSSSAALGAKEFVDMVAVAARGMITDEEPVN